jgi:hypothetical protein
MSVPAAPVDAPAIALSFEDIVLRSHTRLNVVLGLVDQLHELDANDLPARTTIIETIEWCVAAVQKDLTLTEGWPCQILSYRPGCEATR